MGFLFWLSAVLNRYLEQAVKSELDREDRRFVLRQESHSFVRGTFRTPLCTSTSGGRQNRHSGTFPKESAFNDKRGHVAVTVNRTLGGVKPSPVPCTA